MAKPQSNLDELMKTNPQAAGLLKNKALLSQILSSPDTKKLMEMLSQKAGDGLQGAAQAAAKGDASQLMGIMDGLMKSKEGAEVVDRLNKNLPPKK